MSVNWENNSSRIMVFEPISHGTVPISLKTKRIKRMKKHTTKWEKILGKHLSDKRLISENLAIGK